jgi:DNA-binding CsgD family transcriptional regulator
MAATDAYSCKPALWREARVMLLTDDGASLDVTAAVTHLVGAARQAGLPGCAPCPAEWAALCVHVGYCSNTDSPMAVPPAPGACGTLTERETQIVARLRSGHTNKEIARALGIKEDTVKKHLHKVFGKLGVRRRAALAGRSWAPASR